MNIRHLGGARPALALVLATCFPSMAWAQAAGSATPPSTPIFEAGADQGEQNVALHAQTTFVLQGHGRFHSPYQGANSLTPDPASRETWDVTLFAGVRPWHGAEIWVNPELDQGFGLNNTVGVAGFPSGEAYKVGSTSPYLKLHRAFLRQTIALGGKRENVEADLNQLAGPRSANRIVVTIGKFSVGDIFDANAYAHDPRGDFLNWSIIDAGTFDYAANAWGYTGGAAAEWYQGRWTVRVGVFLTSDVPNSDHIDSSFRQTQWVGELEERHRLLGRPGKVRVTGFVTRARMAKLDEAVALASLPGTLVDPINARHLASRPGVSVGLEQELTDDLGLFARAGWADGRYEAFEFTDIDRTVSGGIALKGSRWGRPADKLGIAGAVNGTSAARQRFLDAGGLGILIGDGRLPHPGDERIIEAFYDLAIGRVARLAVDYQYVTAPAYNRDRGPVNLLAVRLHGHF